jgi:hypothetical protein
MMVWCREHHNPPTLLAVVRLHGTWPEFVTLSPKWKAHHAADAWANGAISVGERANSFKNLRGWTRPDIEAKGCEMCGPRMLDVVVLLQAFEEGRVKISL